LEISGQAQKYAEKTVTFSKSGQDPIKMLVEKWVCWPLII
jgi:hypothetical protein